MTTAGFPVPPGFTITTEACRGYYGSDHLFPEGMWSETDVAIAAVEGITGKEFGSVVNPLTDAEIEAKLRDEAQRWKPGRDVQKLIDAVWSLEKSDDVSTLAALTRP